MHPSPDGPALPQVPLKLRDIPAAPVRPAEPAPAEPATAVEPRAPGSTDGPRDIPAPRERFGHYVVLHKLGEGAMGVVLAAYDQHLDRKVALKLMRADIGDRGEGVHHRMRREAQAMARLSHPNVAQVYEAGEVDGHLFLAMEFIHGTTLRAWTLQRQRPWREVLAVFLQAGAGLAAAHAAGLTHRDFKPDNVMVGADGRVCVLDFGLSRGRGDGPRSQIAITRRNLADVGVTAAGSMLGTPAYMSPEQFRGDAADARSDQFGFCAALWEGLYGRRPFLGGDVRELRANVLAGKYVPPPDDTRVPARLRKILERGLSLAAADRWPGMDALLAALAHDPQQTRRRRAVTGLAALAVGAVGYAGAAYRNAAAGACSGAADELAGVWDEPQRAAIDAAVRGTAAAYADATLAATVAHLDGYRDGWISAHTAACEAHRRGSVSDSLLDRRMQCLRQRRAELAATVTVLQQTTAETVAQAAATATGLPALAACEDDARLMNDRPGPSDPAVAAAIEGVQGRLARAHALARNLRYQDALAALAPLQREAEALGDPRLHAEVLHLFGRVTGDTLHPAEALAPLERAEALAIEAGADAVAAEALTTWISLGPGAGRPREALAAGPRAWAHVRRVGSPPALAARLHRSVASVRFELGDADGSLAEFEAALALLGGPARDEIDRVPIVHDVVLTWCMTGRHASARDLGGAELTRMTTTHGACHPDTAALRLALAQCETGGGGRIDEAREHAEQSFVCLADAAPQPALRALSLLVGLAYQRNDLVEVRRHLERAAPLLTRVGDDPALRVTFDMYRAQLAVSDGRTAEAGPLLAALHAQLSADGGAKEYLALVVSLQCKLALAEGDPTRALAHATAANQLLPPAAPPQYRASLRFAHARALRAVEDRSHAVRVAEEAIADYESAGPGFAAKVDEIRQWIADPAAP